MSETEAPPAATLIPGLAAAARAFFQHCDSDGSGSISPIEFTRELKKQGKQWRMINQARPNGRARRMSWFDRPLAVYQAIDNDASGEIDEAEFVEYATTSRDKRVIEMLLGPDGFAAWEEAQKESVPGKDIKTQTKHNPYVAPTIPQPKHDPVPVEDNADELEIHIDVNTGRRFSWNPATDESKWLSSASDDDEEEEEEEEDDRDEEIMALKDQIAALKAHAAEADAKLKEIHDNRAAQNVNVADAAKKIRPPVPPIVGGTAASAHRVQQQDLRQRLARSEAIALKWKQEAEEARRVDRRKSYIYSPKTKMRADNNSNTNAGYDRHSSGADMRQLQAMLTVLGEQVVALSEQRDAATADSAANPHDQHKRIMLRQIELRFKDEQRALRILQEEIEEKRAYESSTERKVKKISGETTTAVVTVSAKRTKQLKKGAAKVTRSPRYRSPEIFNMKGATAAKKGVLYSNFNRTPRFKWQNRNDNPSPSKYAPKYEGTCQQTYLYRHDTETLKDSDSRRNQQLALLKARNRRGSTLGYFNEHKAQFPNSVQAQLQLEDAGQDGDEKFSRIKELEAALSNSRRRESFVKADYVHRHRMETREREQSDLEIAQLEHRQKTLERAAQKVIEATDQYIADVLHSWESEANWKTGLDTRKQVLPDYRLIGPLHSMRMLIRSPSEPAHMTALREMVAREGGGHIHDRTVADRIVSAVDPRMGVQHQYMGAPSSSLLRQEEDLLPPPPPPPGLPSHNGLMRSASPPRGEGVVERGNPDGSLAVNPKQSVALNQSPSAADRKEESLYSRSRFHSAVDVAQMPLPSAMRFLFMCYANAGTLSKSSWLRMLRDAMLFTNDFRFERITSLVNNALEQMAWADFEGAIRALGNIKYAGNTNTGSSSGNISSSSSSGNKNGTDKGLNRLSEKEQQRDLDLNAEKIKQRYLLPLAISVSKDNGIVPHPTVREALNRIYNPTFMLFMSKGATATRLKQLFVRMSGSNYDQFALLLKDCDMVPRHLTGSDVAKIWRGVRSGKPRGGFSSYADTQDGLHQSVSISMGSSSRGDDQKVFRLDYPAFCEAMAIASFFSFSSLGPHNLSNKTDEEDPEGPRDQILKVLAFFPVGEESVVLDRFLSQIDENLLLDESKLVTGAK